MNREEKVNKMLDKEIMLLKAEASGYYSSSEAVAYAVMFKDFVESKYFKNTSYSFYELDGKYSDVDADISYKILPLKSILSKPFENENEGYQETLIYEYFEDFAYYNEGNLIDENKLQDKMLELFYMLIKDNQENITIILDSDTTINQEVYKKGTTINIESKDRNLNLTEKDKDLLVYFYDILEIMIKLDD